MEEPAPIWDYRESALELKHKLLCTMFELESTRTEASEAIRKDEENIKQLLELLKTVCQERDEARIQLQQLLYKLSPSTSSDIGHVHPDIHPETYNYYIDPNSSTDLITLSNWALQKPHFLEDNGDPAMDIIDSLMKGSTLPEKGKFLEAVMEAGPLLETLFVGGPPLPQWRKPPSLQTFLTPSDKGRQGNRSSLDRKSVLRSNSKTCSGASSRRSL